MTEMTSIFIGNSGLIKGLLFTLCFSLSAIILGGLLLLHVLLAILVHIYPLFHDLIIIYMSNIEAI